MSQYTEYKDSGIPWIGVIPKDWEIRKNRHLFWRVKNIVGNDELSYPVLSLSINGVIEKDREDNSGKIPAVYANYYQIIKTGNLLLCLFDMDVTPCLVGYIEKTGIISPAYSYFEPLKKGTVYPKYYYYWYLRMHKDNLFIPLSNNVRSSINNDDFKEIVAPCPPLKMQKNIADYLDTKTSAIDTLIADKENFIGLLKEKRQAIIRETITKGLNKKTRMKDSGVEWIGEIPEEWEVITVSKVCNVIRGASPRPAGDPLFFNGNDIPWITVAEVTKGDDLYLYETESYLTLLGKEKSRYIEPETLLLSNSGATLGVPKITKIAGCINDGSVAFTNLSVNQLFLLYVFKSLTFELRRQMQGYGQPNLNTTIIKNIVIPNPALAEQEEIVESLHIRTTKIDSIISDIQSQIEKLKEYRQSVISEVVTGKVAI